MDIAIIGPSRAVRRGFEEDIIEEMQKRYAKIGGYVPDDAIASALSDRIMKERVPLRCQCGCRRRLMRVEPAEECLHVCEVCFTMLVPVKVRGAYKLRPV